MSELLTEALSMAEILIIKRDFDLLRKLATQIMPELQMQLVPYTALFCHEVVEYLNMKGNNVQIDQTSKFSIKDVRQKAKFFDLSINKLLRSITNVDQLQNEYFVNQMRYPKLGRWNVHDNIGISYDEHKNIVGNTHYAYYVFQDEKTISSTKNTMQGKELHGQEIRSFAYDMGCIIGSISSALSKISDFMVSDINMDSIILLNQDFNTNRCMIAGNENYKIVRLFLLHVLSSIGFVLHILKRIIIRESGLLLRLEYITYHYALLRLEGIMNYCINNKEVVDDSNLLKMLSSIDYTNCNGLKNSEIRNCMMHFGLFAKDGQPLINVEKIDFSIPFCGLIESQFNISYDAYKSKIEQQLVCISEKIRNYLGFELLLDVAK